MATARPTVRVAPRIRAPASTPRVMLPPQPVEVGPPAVNITGARENLTQPAGGVKTMLIQALGQLGGWWPNKDLDSSQAENLPLQNTQVVELKEVKEATKEAIKSPKKPPSILPYLKPAGLADVRLARFMSSLSNLAYDVGKITPHKLWRCHRLRLVTTSTTWKQPTDDAEQVEEAVLCGDGMTTTPPEEPGALQSLDTDLNNIVAIKETLRKNPVNGKKSAGGPWMGTTKALAEATMFAANSVSSAAGTFYQQAVAQLAKQATNSVPGEQVMDTVSRVLSVLYATLSFKDMLGSSNQEVPVELQKKATKADSSKDVGRCPFEWYVADDPKRKLRVFAIQGSVGLDTWQINLTFDPVVFEDESLGVRVHRGAYETAQYLYDFFEPLVVEHLRSTPDAKITFTGHSLGGSLGTLLALMFVHRGVLSPEAIHPVFTFGAAAVFCEGASGCANCQDCSLASYCGFPASEEVCPSGGLLDHLGLPLSSVMNIMMHRDIVPKAFACNYTSVVPILRTVGSSFREHRCLGGRRAMLYNFLGNVLILQPCEKQKYVKGEGYHPMIPGGTGLYFVTNPDSPAKVEEGVLQECTDSNGDAVMAEVRSQREAVQSLMDSPHPLEILGDPGAYGDGGTISRYHNPENYIRGLRSVLVNRQQTQWEGLVNLMASRRWATQSITIERKLGSYTAHSLKIRRTPCSRHHAWRLGSLHKTAAGQKQRKGGRSAK